MKILISSKVLGESLKEFLEENSFVENVMMHDSHLRIIGTKSKMDIYCDILEFKPNSLPQMNARWDWVRDLLKACSEQPIVVQIQKNQVQIIFQY